MATNKVFCSYQEVIDLHTESNTVSVVGIHTPTGDIPKQMFSGFYKQFRKMKYLGCSLAMVPAARLPADPLQVSYEAGEPTIDPRDMLNPIMFHGCHGDDMGAILNQFYQAPSVDLANGFPQGSEDRIHTDRFSSAEMTTMVETVAGVLPLQQVYEHLYYKALTDKTWSKHHPQVGLKKSGLHPRVYQLVTDRQMLPTTGGRLAGSANGTGPLITEYYNGNPESRAGGAIGPNTNTVDIPTTVPGTIPGTSNLNVGSSPAGFLYGTTGGTGGSFYPAYTTASTGFFTNRTVPLGWMDTYQQVTNQSKVGFVPNSTSTGSSGNYMAVDTQKNALAAALGSTWTPANLPRVFMGMILLPPAYKTEQYYRLVLNHRFAFAGFRGISMQSETVDETLDVPSYFNANGDGVDTLHPDSITERPWGSDPI